MRRRELLGRRLMSRTRSGAAASPGAGAVAARPKGSSMNRRKPRNSAVDWRQMPSSYRLAKRRLT